MKRFATLVTAGLLASLVPAAGLASTQPNDQESLYDLLKEFGSARDNAAELMGDATGLAETLDNCDRGAPQFTLFLPSKKIGRGPLFDVLVDNSGRSLGELLARPAMVLAFFRNNLARGLVSESMMTDPKVKTITMESGEVLTKTIATTAAGVKTVKVGGQVVIDGLRSIGHPNSYSTCNGVVYFTDGIFNPRGNGRLSLLRSGPNLYQRIVENGMGQENIVQMMIDAAGLGDSLTDCREEASPVTLFLPGPGAVGAGVLAQVLTALEESLGSLLAKPDLVRELLQNHIVDGLITPESLLDPDNDSYTTRSGLELLKDVGTRPDGSTVVFINGHEVVAGLVTSRFGQTYETCSGALYFIDGFLSPERALAALGFSWHDSARKWGDNRFRFGLCEDHVPWKPSCVDLP